MALDYSLAMLYHHPSFSDSLNTNQTSANSEIAFTNIYASYRLRAFKRQLNFNISKSQFKNLITQNCHYCGSEPANIKIVRTQTFIYNGLDRIDNERHYTIDNVVPCCKVCNFMKRSLSVSDFLGHIKAISHHSIQGMHSTQ